MTGTGRLSAFGALRIAAFRTFFYSLVLSHMGNWMQQFAISWLVVEIAIRDGNPALVPFHVGLVGFSRAVPAFVSGVVGGVVADQRDRRMLLTWTRIVCICTGVGLAALTYSGHVALWHLFVAAALGTAAFGFESPSRWALASDILEGPDLFSGISLVRLAVQGAVFTGPMLGGLLVIPFGVGGVLLATGLMFTVAAGLMLLLSVERRGALAEPTSPWGSVRAAARYVLDDQIVRSVITTAVLYALLSQSYIQVLAAVAHDSLGTDAVGLSLLISANGIGAVCGSFIIASLGGVRRWFGRLLLGDLALLGTLMVGFGVQRSLALSMVLLFFMGATTLMYGGGANTVLQMMVRNEMRGRIAGLLAAIAQTGMAIGALAIGATGTLVGMGTALSLFGMLTVAVAVHAWLFNPTLRELEIPRSG